MGPAGCLIRPATLEEGREYLQVERWVGRHYLPAARVVFVSYTACPAMIVIRGEAGGRVRCPRDDLFARLIPARWETSPAEDLPASQGVKNDHD